MVQVTELGYVGLGVKDLDGWKDFAANVVGLEVSDEGKRDRFYLRMDYWHHRFVLHSDPSDDLLYLGFRVAGPQEFHEMRSQLESAGIKYRVGSDKESDERHVLEVMKLEDPAGNPIEIFHGPEVLAAIPFQPGRRMHGRFKTDTGGLGHCIVRENDLEAACRFYRALGMRGGIEYRIRMGGQTVNLAFMHCNDRDHTVAFGVGDPNRRLNHVMLECENLDDVGMTYDLVRSKNVPVAITPGRHSNDHMYSFYFRTPSGWMFEYGWGGRPATYQSEYYLGDMYGHHPESGGFGPPPEPK